MDRRTIWAILLMMTIAIVPAIFLKKLVPPAARGGEAGKRLGETVVAADSPGVSAARSRDSISGVQPGPDTTKAVASPPTRLPADHVIHVTSPLYTYGISTRGGRVVEATLPHYRSMAPADRDIINVRYAEPMRLLADLRAMGETAAFAERNPHALSRRILARAFEIYRARFSDGDARVRATFEILTITGWAPHESQQKPLKPGSAKASLEAAVKKAKRE
jgi:hypothetical protein